MSITRTATRSARPLQLFYTPLRTQSFNMSSTTAGQDTPTFGLKERQPSTEEKQLIDDVLQLYKLNPISSAYARYAENAKFHDPIGIAEGLNSIKAQFNSMPSIFSKSEVKGMKVLENPEVKPPSVQFALSQLYTFKAGNMDKLVNSKITLHVDPSTNQITQHDEEWDGKPNSTGEDGFFGKLNEMRKKFTANTVEKMADTRPKDQQN
ncbi:hypothetical protein BD324DRAFT_630799 [Kockovaella imperatae]|uniref:Uncharacterized protein n=1 Tax=Kockovaella imperatae TaxID=4999 RepID=A0A1Y1UDH3_9TREE|nr:hypothetical protein BD324DRAFT_630799 [Kockovaella imperatae]ORX35597.1 hypothetical protein BD324DRAFT_630799 [Kockovaella imperatae]